MSHEKAKEKSSSKETVGVATYLSGIVGLALVFITIFYVKTTIALVRTMKAIHGASASMKGEEWAGFAKWADGVWARHGFRGGHAVELRRVGTYLDWLECVCIVFPPAALPVYPFFARYCTKTSQVLAELCGNTLAIVVINDFPLGRSEYVINPTWLMNSTQYQRFINSQASSVADCKLRIPASSTTYVSMNATEYTEQDAAIYAIYEQFMKLTGPLADVVTVNLDTKYGPFPAIHMAPANMGVSPSTIWNAKTLCGCMRDVVMGSKEPCVIMCNGYSGTGKTATLFGYARRNSTTTGLVHCVLKQMLKQTGKAATVSAFEVCGALKESVPLPKWSQSFNRVSHLTHDHFDYDTITHTARGVSSVDELNAYIADIQKQRYDAGRVTSTPNNPQSSRSHMFLKITSAEGRSVWFVDLGGHEAWFTMANTISAQFGYKSYQFATDLHACSTSPDNIGEVSLKYPDVNVPELLKMMRQGVFIAETLRHVPLVMLIKRMYMYGGDEASVDALVEKFRRDEYMVMFTKDAIMQQVGRETEGFIRTLLDLSDSALLCFINTVSKRTVGGKDAIRHTFVIAENSLHAQSSDHLFSDYE